ncbi:restriction endonuclease subunit S [Aliivibrio fischeri]|uniref:restriction endonuclease subunit S n=1 Tax=Aliivibrio fischeri TaxID=668 RepID=UPI0007C5B2C1|nr:restriction endonuclease subunit S [Aliivibrio fischeri]MBP3140855.1 restriction endonuclease subunit S [Aliivibrio fischeri]
MSNLSYLEKLLDGVEVEWKKLADVFQLKNGYTPSKSKKEFWENGTVPWFRMDDIRENGQILDGSLQKVSESAIKGGKLFSENSIIIATSATIGEHALIRVPFLANQRFTNLSLKPGYKDTFNSKFIFYYCFILADWCKKNTTMSSFASVDMDGFKKFPFPIPCPNNPEKSLAIQAEIVRILDAFTTMTAELTAELNMRKKQYNYYRDQLLSFEDGEVEWKALGDVCESITSGKNKDKSETGKFPVYGSTGVIGRTNIKAYEIEQILVARVGANAGRVNIASGEYDVSDNTLILKLKTKYNLKFLYYYLVNLNLNRFVKGAGQPLLTAGQLKTMVIPVPTPEEQSRIVSILDNFDSITNSINEGLPREIELRQKQYEYYRDLLLSFPKSDTTEVL